MDNSRYLELSMVGRTQAEVGVPFYLSGEEMVIFFLPFFYFFIFLYEWAEYLSRGRGGRTLSGAQPRICGGDDLLSCLFTHIYTVIYIYIFLVT